MAKELNDIHMGNAALNTPEQLLAFAKSIPKPNADLSLNIESLTNAIEKAQPISKNLIKSVIHSMYDARPINAVDTFGVNPIIDTPNVLVTPASAPVTFSYSVRVPLGRTYVLRDFYFVPTRFLFNEFNNPISDLFTLSFFVDESPVSENTNLTFPSWGTGGYVPDFFIAPENSIIRLRAQITNPLYLDMDFAFPVFISASIAMRFNALLNNGAPANMQIGTIIDDMNILGDKDKLNGLNEHIDWFKKYGVER